MLPYDKDWLQKEVYQLEAQVKKDKSQKKDTTIMFQWISYLLLFFFSVASAQDFIIVCPHCREVMECKITQCDHCDYELKVKPGEWTCPNPKCRYKNDNRMRYCSLCGSERQ